MWYEFLNLAIKNLSLVSVGARKSDTKQSAVDGRAVILYLKLS